MSSSFTAFTLYERMHFQKCVSECTEIVDSYVSKSISFALQVLIKVMFTLYRG